MQRKLTKHTQKADNVPVPELRSQRQKACLVLRRRVQSEERVVFYARLPQVLAGPIADHVEPNQVLYVLVLVE